MIKPTRITNVLLFLLLLQALNLQAQLQTNKGKDFWICFPKHTPSGAQLARMVLYISSGCDSVRGTIRVNNYVDSFKTTSAETFIEKEIPFNIAYMNEENTVSNKGIHISANSKLTVYAHIYAGVRSASYMALPEQYFGNHYFSMNYTQRSTNGSSSQFQVIASEANTRIRITPRIGTLVLPAFVIDLPNAGNSYQYTSSGDLSGSQIESIAGPDGICKNIAVFSGSSGTSILSANCNGPDSYDPLVQQLYPAMYWGNNYLLAPFSQNPAGYHVRVIASENNTAVLFNGVQQATLQKGESYPPVNSPQIPVQGDLSVDADKPVSVAQYLLSSACNNSNNGDPDMVLAVPILNYPRVRSVYTTTRQNIASQSIKVVMPTAVRDSFMVNGNFINTGWTASQSNPGFSYNNIPMPVTNQSVKLATGIKSLFNFDAQVYGLGDAESYVYSASVGLPVPFLSVNDKITQFVNRDEGFTGRVCKDEQFKLRLYSPFPVDMINWDLVQLGGPVLETSPNLVDFGYFGGKYFWIYEIQTLVAGNTAGEYTVYASFSGTYPGQCKRSFITEIRIQVLDKPVVQIGVSHNRCLKDSVQFSGLVAPCVPPANDCKSAYSCAWADIDSWQWDFGDGTYGSGQTPYHFYNAPGIYTVKLFTTNKANCPIDVVTRQIIIDTLSKANFGASAPYCEKQRIVLTDSSRFFNITDTLKEWHWNLGDGTVFTRTDSARFEHTYSDTGWYTVSLVVKTKYGCMSDTLKKAVYVSAVPEVKFGFTNACQNDPFVQFTDSSTIKDKTESSFSYLWTFGDPAATPSNPDTAIIKNPQHQYTLAGTFPVSLTVTSAAGCRFKKDSVITISSAVAAVDFTVSSANQFCSEAPVLLTNLSSIVPGNINKLKIYWDALNNINDVTLDSIPFASANYQHQYNFFNNTPDRKDYTIKLEVASGQTCSTGLSKIITLHAMPLVQFNPPAGICRDTPYVLVTSAAETTNLSGTGNYFGPGITPAGLFDVNNSSPGIYRLGYAFASNAGCTDTAYANMEVFATPTVNAGPDIVLPDDYFHTFNIQTTGSVSTYLWSPPLYLNSTMTRNPTITRPANDVLYTVKVTSANGCEATDKIFVKVTKGIAIPNTFTPNNDGINDLWLIDNLAGYSNCTVQVFTRTGQKVYESRGYKNPWNGLYKGKKLTTDTYFYIIELNNGSRGITGYVQIVR